MKNFELLSVDEVKKLPEDLVKSDGWYWLRPVAGDISVHYVNEEGVVLGKAVEDLDDVGGIRVVGDCDESLKVGSSFFFNHYEFVVFEKGRAVSKELVETGIYSEDGNKCYEESDVYDFICWLNSGFEEQRFWMKQAGLSFLVLVALTTLNCTIGLNYRWGAILSVVLGTIGVAVVFYNMKTRRLVK